MIRLLSGDCRDVLPTLPAESVQCVVTSPPYYGLRDYGTALWDGGDAACSHAANRGASASSGLNGSLAHKDGRVFTPYRDTCGKCGAVRVDQQIGLEATPDEYLATMAQVFREVRRVLRRDGTCWVNMGDSYSSGSRTTQCDPSEAILGKVTARPVAADGGARRVPAGVAKPKDLLLMPARLALALQADGWWVRSDIIWHKPNPMPESCTDRPTSAHEHVFLLTKSARYFYDAEAVREPSERPEFLDAKRNYVPPSRRLPGDTRDEGRRGAEYCPGGARNLRNVWTLATHAYPEAHFATFPPELAERCIKAGTSERGCCAACGKPWGRQSDTSYERNRHGHSGRTDASGSNGWDGGAYPNLRKLSTTTGWAPGCQCDAEAVPCTVLDPFAGAGTTLLVADRLQRDAVGIELNTAYTEMAMERCRQDAPLFTAFPPAEDPEEARMGDLFQDMAAD